MPDPYAYERTPYETELDVEILDHGQGETGAFALVVRHLAVPRGRRTAGGPRMAWRASHRGSPTVRTPNPLETRSPSSILWMVRWPPAGTPVTLRLDWSRRYDLMQQHTAQHLLTAVATGLFGWTTTSFHLGNEVCAIELDTAEIRKAQLDQLEEAVAAEVRAAPALWPLVG